MQLKSADGWDYGALTILNDTSSRMPSIEHHMGLLRHVPLSLWKKSAHRVP